MLEGLEFLLRPVGLVIRVVLVDQVAVVVAQEALEAMALAAIVMNHQTVVAEGGCSRSL